MCDPDIEKVMLKRWSSHKCIIYGIVLTYIGDFYVSIADIEVKMQLVIIQINTLYTGSRHYLNLAK